MSSDDGHTLLSVRGEARLDVAPDEATVSCSVTNLAATPADAAAAVSGILAALTGELAALGGKPLTSDTVRSPLTWSAQSMSVQPEFDHDKVTGVHGPTGRHHASVTVMLTVRDFGLLEDISSVVTGHGALSVHSVEWTVDADNPGWPQVRADAIHTALRTGQDYAAALGGAVVTVVHVADAGLLGGERPAGGSGRRLSMALSAGAGGSITLDPVPQQLSAVIEARFTATVGPLPQR